MKPELHHHVIRHASCLFWAVSLAVRQFWCPLRCLGTTVNIIGHCASPDAAPIDTKSLCCMPYRLQALTPSKDKMIVSFSSMVPD
ncbi:hypothetical protein BDV41DRAFT_542169 [Aspergillus transmontanensis]|uniref:Secreted protein n=1 Tax=Aspergillus transmontanensis TaxID=1034304 RepID=A0A5N6VRX4_9EURO|nr:hypothetical protein BDV41DRAFT_542169 [Aspergillus transmontanensis]